MTQATGDGELDAPEADTTDEAIADLEGAGDTSAPDGGDADDEVEEVDFDEIIAELEREVAAMKDRWLRAVADHENYKKRAKRDVDDAVFRARQHLLKDFLPTVDNLDRALGLAGGDDNLAQGIRMVRDAFMKALAKYEIEAVPGVGARFDPAFHEALQQVKSDEYAPGVVILEYEKGFRQGDRLLRAARVIVASPDSTGPEPGDDEGAAASEPEAAN